MYPRVFLGCLVCLNVYIDSEHACVSSIMYKHVLKKRSMTSHTFARVLRNGIE